MGFVQLPWHGNREARLVESTFGLLYDLVRSLRGVVIFLTYICKRSVLRRFRNLLRSSRNVDEIVATLGVAARQHPPHYRRDGDRFNAVGKVDSQDTTKVSSAAIVSYHNQACNINGEGQEEKVNDVSPAENQMNDGDGISQVFAKAIGAELVINSENSQDTKWNDMIETKEQQPMEDFIIYV